MAPVFPHLGSKWRWVVSITSRPLYSCGRSLRLVWLDGSLNIFEIRNFLAPAENQIANPQMSGP
jgi:hypothetical protein